jgi:cellulose synthase/poly-beta-1,6-N-acetylglucosamine synthase-like glycosyltransferase
MDLPKISIIFPIYKKSKYLENNIQKILKDPYPNDLKEIIISIDSPKDDFLNKLIELKNKYKNITLVISKERRGKVSATNDAVKISSGEILFFFDSDVIIDYININELVKELKEYDIIEFYKEIIKKGWLSYLIFIEFSSYFDIIDPILNRIKRPFFLNGGGFATKKSVWNDVGGYSKVYVEDVDFAMKAGKKGYKYYMSTNVKLLIEPLTSLRKWIEQRKRWGFGLIEVILNHLDYMIDFFIHNLLTTILILLILYLPYLIWTYIYIYLPVSFLYQFATNIYKSLSSNISFIYLIILSPSSIFKVFYILYLTLLYILLTSTYIYLLISIKRRKLYNFLPFILFSILYIPLYEIIIIYDIIYYGIFERAPKMNWKV